MNAQEQFWSGEFGSSYTARNRVDWNRRVPFWAKILDVTQARSVLEVGCNAGWNLQAIKSVNSAVHAVGIDVNSDAVGEARTNEIDAHIASAFEAAALFPLGFDLVFTAGVLIHISPDCIDEAMRNVIEASKRWILAVEYDSEEEDEIIYRGHSDRLWKRPFGKMYQERGLSTVAVSDPAGFDRCRAWLMVKR